MAFFSVVIPVLNQVATLTDALASLYQQTYRDFEVVAVDCGSTDGSYQLLEEHERKGRIRLFQREEWGQRHQAAWNFGAEQARATWLVFFDADSILLFDHLSRFADAIGRHADVELFVNAHQKLQGHQRLPRWTGLQSGVSSRLEALAAIARHDFIHTGGVCIRRGRFLALGGFPADRHRCEDDAWLWLKMLCELDKIHYDDTVTSLVLLKRDYVVPEECRMQVHHATKLVAEYADRLVWRESRYLHVTINRMILDLAMLKKHRGQAVSAELASLRLVGLTIRLWPRLFLLILPLAWFRRLQPS